MENQEIIELGSSDDEAGPPAPKKVKPLPNAMVHIPKKSQAISLNPLSSNTSHKHKHVSGKSLSITKLSNITAAPKFATSTLKNISNGRYTQNCTSKPMCMKIGIDKAGSHTNKLNINPINVINRRLNRQTFVSNFIKPAVKIQQQQVLTKLPPSITITRTQSASNSVQSAGSLGMNKFRVNKKIATNPSTFVKKMDSKAGGILTVELDDDDNSQSSSATGSPQWYLRPEEQLASNSLEVKNNMEPESCKMIEITIEDSPVKPCLLKETNANKDLFITIEDSPTKLLNEPVTECIEKGKIKSPPSKKQLSYPKNNESMVDQCESSIEATAMEVDVDRDKFSEQEKNLSKSLEVEDEYNQKNDQPSKQNYETNNDNESQICDVNVVEKMTENNSQDKENMKSLHIDNENNDEFHPIVQKFINLCCEIDKTDDMKKIIDKRIKNYYRQVSKAYVESEEFLDLVSSKMLMTEADPTKMYLYLKDVVDELNLQRKMAKTCHVANQQNSLKDADADDHNINHNSKQQRQIRKLEKTIKKLNRAINKLEEQEVDFDDEEDSVYLLTERYKERLIRVYEKFCKMSNTKMPSEPHIQLQSQPGKPLGPARKLEKLINKKVPLGTPLPFPDFHDVLKCVKEANEEDRLGWNEGEIMHEARGLFTTCGRKLQRRRQENEWRLAASRITQSVDPAEKDISLKQKLDDNKKVAERKETEIFNRYADKQKQLQLEGTEIADKEADESLEESEDEELNDNSNSLDDRQKRKDRLRRLLEEKAIKLTKEGETSKNYIKKKTLVDSLSSDNKDGTKSENEINCNEVECKQKLIKDNLQEITKSVDLKAIIHEDQIECNTNFIENGCKEGINKRTENFVIGKETELIDNIYLINDDSDELNLLQKLHSGNEISESSESGETTEAVSDTSESDGESEDNNINDVISIENSSYSESELTKHDVSADINTINKNIEAQCNSTDKLSDINVADTPVDTEINNDYDENVLLASSEDEDNANKSNDHFENECINFKDDESEKLITDGKNKKIALNKSSYGYVNLNDNEITISETFIGTIENVDGMNIAIGINSENLEGEVGNKEGKYYSDDKPEKESYNDNIKNKTSDENEPCRGSVNCNDTNNTRNNICTCSKKVTSNAIIYGILTDTIANVKDDKSEHEKNYCTHLHFRDGIQTINDKNHSEVIDCTQPTPSEEIDNNSGTIALATLNADGGTHVHNSSNVTTTSQYTSPSRKCIELETKSIEMMLEEMFN